MEQVIFNCLTPGELCEWFHLRDFVKAFNDVNGTSYSRSKCLDVYGAGDKQPAQAPKRPEVLLESNSGDEVPMVIERKAVVWPSDFQRNHTKEHDLFEGVSDRLGEEFNDSTYQLDFHADDLKGKKKKQVDEFGNQIAHLILSDIGNAKSREGIDDVKPIRWGFRPLEPREIDEANLANGIQSLVTPQSPSGPEPPEHRQSRETALAGFAERFSREANNAGKKYDEYPNCQKLLVVQFFGESDSVMDEEIIEIIKAAPIPNQIDQVWLTGREWIGLDDYELAWEHVR